MQNMAGGVAILVLEKVNFTSKLIITVKDKLSNSNPNIELYNNYGTTNI